MKKLQMTLLVLAILTLLVGGVRIVSGAPTGGPSPTIVIQPSHILLQGTATKVAILGSGFEPKQEIHLVITHKDGSKSDIGSQLKPAPVANQDGVWGTAWTVGAFSAAAVAAPEMYIMMACDSNYNVLATTPFGYYDAKAAYDKWPTWAQAVIPKPAAAPATK